MVKEIEVKIAIADPAATRRELVSLGAALVEARSFEDNRLFDLPGFPLRDSGRLLRVRTVNDRTVVTAKGPSEPDAPGEPPAGPVSRPRYKIRTEAETEVPDDASFVRILETAGLDCCWRYQKYRTTYALDGVVVVVDELPFGSFVELEGEPARIDAVAERLGVHASRWITDSYRDLHEADCARRGVPVGDLVFENREAGTKP